MRPMINEDWYVKAEALVREARKLGNGTVNLNVARLARELFQYDSCKEKIIELYSSAVLLDIPEENEYAARLFLEEEEEARIVAMEHRL